MKNILIIVLVLGFVAASFNHAYAADPNRQTAFNDVTDFLATIGKSDDQKRKIKRMRQNARRKYRQLKNRMNTQARTQKTIKKQQREIMKHKNLGRTTIGN